MLLQPVQQTVIIQRSRRYAQDGFDEVIIFVAKRHLVDVQKDQHRVGPYPLVAVDERMVTDETEAQTGSLFQQRGI